ncbi:MAG TPA: M28 family peptidase [Longimicrobiales bacterium]
MMDTTTQIVRSSLAALVATVLAACSTAGARETAGAAASGADQGEPGTSAASCPAPPAGSDIASVVRYLADDALEGRLAGSAGERCAGDYIAASFRRMGLQPAGENGTYFQDVPLASATNPHAPGGTGRNVVARLEGRDPALRDEAIVIGAHYDHLGRGGFGSLAPDARDAVHNGADDNASGVAALLAVAERLAADPPARSVIFVAFTGEESGLLGSAHYTAHPAVPLERTRAMLNMDMVGRLGAGPLIVYGTGTAAEWDGILDAAASAAGIELARKEDGYGPSDHTSFYLKDIPVLHFFTNTHDDYHRPSDDWERIDVRGIERVVAVVEAAARSVADRRAALTLRRGAGTPPSASQGRGYGAYLGSIPDYTPADRGVRIAGVREGSPAERAGLRAGDIIIGFDDEEIADIYAMTEALRARKPGDRVRIRVLREGREVTLTAVLGERGGD